MDQYQNQRYFASVCHSFAIAYSESKRLGEMKEKTQQEENDFFTWAHRAKVKRNEYERLLLDAVSEGKSYIINTEAEIIALLFFYGVHSVEKWRVINEKETHIMDFPRDDFSVKFKKAYFEKDDEAMHKLLEEYAMNKN